MHFVSHAVFWAGLLLAHITTGVLAWGEDDNSKGGTSSFESGAESGYTCTIITYTSKGTWVWSPATSPIAPESWDPWTLSSSSSSPSSAQTFWHSTTSKEASSHSSTPTLWAPWELPSSTSSSKWTTTTTTTTKRHSRSTTSTTTLSTTTTTTTTSAITNCNPGGIHPTFMLQVSPASPTDAGEYLVQESSTAPVAVTFQNGTAGAANFTFDDNCDLLLSPSGFIASIPGQTGAYTIEFDTAADIASSGSFNVTCDIVASTLQCASGPATLLQSDIFDTLAIGSVINSGDEPLTLIVHYVT